jgi:hypothetical protein
MSATNDQLLKPDHHTFKELLAGVFLEKSFVCDRSMEIVKHKLEHWLNLLFCITGEVSKEGVLRETLVDCETEEQTINIPMDRFRVSVEQHTSPWQQHGSVDIS